MQNAGQQYGQGGATSHQTAPFGHTSEPTNNHNGSITSSLRQFRKDKQPLSDNNSNTVTESHVARVAPHNHYPPNRSNECYQRYPTSQYQDYNIPSQVKYSEISGHHTVQEAPTSASSVIQKAKGGKEYLEVGNIQPQMKQQHYPDHLNNQQSFNEGNVHGQYIHKEAQVHPSYKPESQYFPKDQFPHQMPPHNIQKYNMPHQVSKYPTSNDFLSKLERINPTMARSIMSDHHLQDTHPPYRGMDQNRMYATQNRSRYPGYAPTSMQNNPPQHTYHYIPHPHPPAYQNYPASCNYNRGGAPQMGGPRFPSIHPQERSMSPRRGYTDNVGLGPMTYGVQQKMSPNYGHQYNPQEYAQHYQHRRLPMPNQEYYPQPCRTAPYLPHQMVPQEVTESRLTVSDNLKQYIENWADEETASEMQIDTGTMMKDNLRVREDTQSSETVYMINASELQYLENGIPLVTSENGIPLVTAENGQYILKNGVSIDNTSSMVRIVNKGGQMEMMPPSGDRVVNLHIMDHLKPPDCMMAAKPNEVNQRPTDSLYEIDNKPRVVVHQNTVIQSSYGSNSTKECQLADVQKIGSSLPMITDEEHANIATSFEDEINRSIIKECKRETVDKNCSPINMCEIQDYKEVVFPTVICPTKVLESSNDFDSTDAALKNMPSIEELCEDALKSSEFHHKETVDESNPKNDTDLGITAEIEENPIAEPGTLALGDTLDSIKCLQEQRESSPSPMPVKFEEGRGVESKPSDVTNNLPETEVQSDSTDSAPKEKGMVAINTPPKEKAMVVINTPPKDDSENDSASLMEQGENEKQNDADITEVDTSVLENNESVSKTDENGGVRRARRFFSVDDIINHIGNNTQKQRSDDEVKRRHSLQSTKEFLQNEIHSTFKFDFSQFQKEKEKFVDSDKAKAADKCEANIDSNGDKVEDKCGEKIDSDENKEEGKCEAIADLNNITEDKIIYQSDNENEPVLTKITSTGLEENVSKEENVELKNALPAIKTDLVVENIVDKSSSNKKPVEYKDGSHEFTHRSCNSDIENISEIDTKTSEEKSKIENTIVEEVVLNETIEAEDNKELSDIPDDPLNLDTSSCMSLLRSEISDQKDASTQSSFSQQNEESRSDDKSKPQAICEVSSKSAMESVTTDTNEVLYRNIIKVEESSILLQIAGELVEINVNSVNGKKVITVVPLSNSAVVDFNDNFESVDNIERDPLKMDDVENNEHFDEIVTEPECVDPTSEIIIGMDLSLEAEIKLDLEQPKVLCTKAAKKAYEYDLQIPSITTSEDVYDKNKTEIYSANDKVSSTREHSSKTKKIAGKSISKSSHSKKVSSKINKNVIKDKNIDELKKKSVQCDDEFVLFSDLVRARKLKKMNIKEKSKQNVKADSTNIVDEAIGELKHTIKSDNDVTKKEKSTKPSSRHKDKSKTDKSKLGSVIVNLPLQKKDGTQINKNIENEVEAQSQEANENINKVKKEEGCEQGKEIEKKVDPCSKTSDELTENSLDTQKSENKEYVKNSSKEAEAPEPISKQQEKSESKLNSSTSEAVDKKKGITEIKNDISSDPKVRPKDVVEGKRKLSLEEYNNRKRRLLSIEKKETESLTKKTKAEKKQPLDNFKIVELRIPRPEKIKFPRHKSLDDIIQRPKENIYKRKFSLEESLKPSSFDWEETQSPKVHQCENKKFSEFRGLIEDTKAKNHLLSDTSTSNNRTTESSEDQILQNYKVQVESKLNTLSLQIPRIIKPVQQIPPTTSSPSSLRLIQRFLRDEKLTPEEIDKIRKIIAYKRVAQQLKSPIMPGSSCDISKDLSQDIKLNIRKLPVKKKKRRFRNLYSESTTESEEDSQTKKNNSDYSVVQSNCLAGVVPKLIIKRKTEFPVPVVRLERLDLGMLINKKRKSTD